jgi:RNA polymerase sigma factor (sigma-70 family)
VPADSRTRPTLLERLRDADDAAAWQDFYDRYWRAMYAFAKRCGCHDQTAEEVVQDAMVGVFHNRGVFRYDPGRGRFRNWLFTLVRQKLALHHRRRQGRARPAGDPLAEPLAPTDAASPEAAWEEVFEGNLLLALLEAVRREVGPETYQAFELTALHDVSPARAARLTGMTRNAVYLARKRVLARLRELGAPYRERGALDERVKRVLSLCPRAAAERTLTTRVQTSLAARGAGPP